MTLPTLKPAVSGDIGDYRILHLDGIDNLDAVTAVAAHVATGTTRVTLDGAVEDATACTVRIELGDDDGWLSTAASAGWEFEVQCTFLNGDVLTWPATAPARLPVRRDRDPVVTP